MLSFLQQMCRALVVLQLSTYNLIMAATKGVETEPYRRSLLMLKNSVPCSSVGNQLQELQEWTQGRKRGRKRGRKEEGRKGGEMEGRREGREEGRKLLVRSRRLSIKAEANNSCGAGQV